MWDLPMKDGWLNLQEAARPIFVSNQGDDRANGSKGQPVKTLKRAMAMKGTGIYLFRGDSWSEQLRVYSGPSKSEPLIIESYGDPNKEAPRVGQVWADKKSFFVIRDLKGIWALTDATIWVYGCSYWWLEGNQLMDGHYGVSAQCHESKTLSGTLNRNVFSGNRPRKPGDKGQGIYANDVISLRLWENFFHDNGRLNNQDDMLSHDAYLAGNNGGSTTNEQVEVIGNVFSKGSATGCQARAGGKVVENLFLDNPEGLTYLLVHGNGPQHKGGGFGEVTRNVFIGNRNPTFGPRGGAMFIGANSKGPTVVRQNLILDDSTGVQAAVTFEVGKGVDAGTQVGFNDILLEENIVMGWRKQGTQAGGIPSQYRNVRLRNNFGFGPVFGPGKDGIKVESEMQRQFPDPNRRVPDYMTSISRKNQSFVDSMLQQSRFKWDPALTGRRAANFILAGFGIGIPVPPPVPPPPPPPRDFTIAAELWTPAAGRVNLLDSGAEVSWPEDGNIQAIISPQPKKVIFYLDGKEVGSQAGSPYFAFGDAGGKPLPGKPLNPGTHTLKILADQDPTPFEVSFVVKGNERTAAELIEELIEWAISAGDLDRKLLLMELKEKLNAVDSTT